MISVAEARQLIAARANCLPAARAALADSLDRVLAEDVASDIDSPPYDKALVDGYAVRSIDFQGRDDPVELKVLEEVTAGRTPSLPLAPGTATRIMTGAPIPSACDSVVMIEESQLTGDVVRLSGGARPEQNLLRQGVSMRQGDLIARRGAVLRAIEIGVLAEVGCAWPLLVPAPSVAVLSTGDELVSCEGRPEHGQIRNSNGPMLEALVRSCDAVPVSLGISDDDNDQLEPQIREGLKSNVLVISGGVSAGVLDLIPPTLKRCGVEEVFHKARLKPGKPVWFGQSTAENTLVFGLPGNPVGSLVCFDRFVRPALQQLAGHTDAFTELSFVAILTKPFRQRGDRPTWHPANWSPESGKVTPLVWQGSADLRTLANANCLIAFPGGSHEFEPGATVTCHSL